MVVDKFQAKLKATKNSLGIASEDSGDEFDNTASLESPLGSLVVVVIVPLTSLAIAWLAVRWINYRFSGFAFVEIVSVVPIVFFLVLGAEVLRLKRWAHSVMVTVLWFTFGAIVLISLLSFFPLSYGIDRMARAELPELAQIVTALRPLWVVGSLCFVCLHYLGKYKRLFTG